MKRRPAMNDGGVRAAGNKLLADGQWHDLTELIAAMAKVVPHGLASREGYAPRGSDVSRKIANGAQRIAVMRAGDALRDGKWEADRPMPWRRAVWHGAEPCRVRDVKANGIPITTVLEKHAKTSKGWVQERPALVAAIPWAGGEVWGRVQPRDIPTVIALVQKWKAEEDDAELRLTRAYRRADPTAREDILKYVESRAGQRVDEGTAAVGEGRTRRGGDASGEQRH